MSDPARWAIYYTPPADHSLAERGNAWLDRADSAGCGNRPASLDHAEWQRIIRAPRRYGFHATLKAPMRLAAGASEATIRPILADIAARHAPFTLTLSVARLGNFLALQPTSESSTLDALADDCVIAADPLRAPLTDSEMARRGIDQLDDRRTELLRRWGYPHVFDQYRFHMTLTGALESNELARLQPILVNWFAEVLATPLPFAELTLSRQDPDDRFFKPVVRVPLTGGG